MTSGQLVTVCFASAVHKELNDFCGQFPAWAAQMAMHRHTYSIWTISDVCLLGPWSKVDHVHKAKCPHVTTLTMGLLERCPHRLVQFVDQWRSLNGHQSHQKQAGSTDHFQDSTNVWLTELEIGSFSTGWRLISFSKTLGLYNLANHYLFLLITHLTSGWDPV